jgi:hypothetical protein
MEQHACQQVTEKSKNTGDIPTLDTPHSRSRRQTVTFLEGIVPTMRGAQAKESAEAGYA